MKHLSVNGAGLHIDREMTLLSPGLVRMRQTYHVADRYLGALVTGPQWLFSLVNVVRGSARFVVGGASLGTPVRFALFIPAFTVVRFDWAACEVVSAGVLGSGHLSDSQQAFVCEAGEARDPDTKEEVSRLVEAGERIEVSDPVDPDTLAGRAKHLLDARHDVSLALSEVARAIGVSRSSLSRAFRKRFGIGPLEYRHRIQIMDAIMRLSDGGQITAAAFDAGFSDLSRFYKQFGKYARTQPSAYRLTPR
jgi:AraC-like DNA-binding protein